MKIAVTSPSFSSHPELIVEMNKNFSDFKLNSDGIRFSEQELIAYLSGFDAAIVGLEEINKRVIDALPDLKIISKYGVGLDNINLEYCKSRGIAIGWKGGVNKLSVAEMVIGNAISLLRNLYLTSNLLKSGNWNKKGGQQLSNKTIGVIGVGHIGKEVIRLLQPFNCKILVNDVIDQSDFYQSVGAIECSKDELFRLSDVITIHTPLTIETKNLINKDSIAKMQKHAIILNTARGGIVNELDLFAALNDNNLGGAALDVYSVEPPEDVTKLAAPNLICTPHIGGNSREAVYLMGMSAIENINDFVR